MKFFCSLILIMFFISCDRDRPYIDCEYPDYSNCLTIEPEYGFLKVSLTFNDANTTIPITVYYGTPEKNHVCLIDTVSSSKVEYVLPTGVFYSVKAEYVSDNKIIHAFDGGFMEKKSFKVCDSTCWVINDVDIDIKLKY